MSVLISGALIDGAGTPMTGCHIILKSRVNTLEVVMRTIADVITGNDGEYSFNARIGQYCVYLRRGWCEDEYCVGDILVDEDSKPGTLNDFLIAPGESDLKPDVVKRFEELLAATQASATEAAGSASSAAGSATAAAASATAAAQAKSDIDAEMADALKAVTSSRSDALQAAEDARRSSGSALVAAGNAQQSAEDALRSGNQAAAQASRAKQSADNAAVSEASALASQNAAEQSAQASRGYRDSAQQIVNGLNDTNASLTEKGLVQLSSATDSESESLAATPKAVRAVMDAVQTKAPLESPALSGTPTTPTPPDGATGNEIANAAFVRTLISALVGSSPEALDTLNELAAALGNDPNFATTVTKALAGKQPLSDVLSSLSGLASSPDKLPYFSDRNVMALANLTATGRELIMQNSRSDVLSYLGVKSAGTKDVQQDIYDRTEGRVALPGAFGYGHAFSAA